MIIKINPFHRRGDSLSVYDPKGIFLRNMELKVLAVIRANHITAFLVYYSIPGTPRALEWLEAKHVDIISDERPKNWIEKKWPFWHQFYKSNQDYSYRISYYAGPSAILEDDHFLFDIYESYGEALRFLDEHGLI